MTLSSPTSTGVAAAGAVRAPWYRRLTRTRLGLRGRMTLSYALTTLAAVLVLELVVAITVWIAVTQTGLAGQQILGPMRQTAKLYALAAAAQAGPTALDPRTTFAPGQPASIAIPAAYFPSGNAAIRYVSGPAADHSTAPFALLLTPAGRVLASSNPTRYPPQSSAATLLPGRQALIASALAGKPGSVAGRVLSGRPVEVAEPVLGHAGTVLGAVYAQVSVSYPANFLRGVTGLLLLSVVFWSFLTLPVGALFGRLTTRGLVRRVNELVTATARFAGGDYAQRVPVARATDEVGQLEWHFNQMADQLVASMAQQQRLVEQQARQEERARIEQELRTARQIQESLLPKAVPSLPGWELTPSYQPATEVGGDFYDFIPFADGRVGIVIGDSSGKGIPAALLMATARTMLRTAARATASPGAVLARVNDLLAGEIVPGMFVTCFYALFDPASGRITFANAGHDVPYRRHGGDVAELRATGMPLGLMPGMRYEEGEATLAGDDTVLFYSDGLVEAHNGAREMFGFPRLCRLVRDAPPQTSLIADLMQDLAAFTGPDWAQEDDITLLTLRGTAGTRGNVGAAPAGAAMDGSATRTLAEFSLPSVPGNERVATERVAEALRGLALPAPRLERLKTAVAEATLNAMEHGNEYRADLPVRVRVRAAPDVLTVRISDEGGAPIAEPPVPDLAAKLAGEQSPRGWGLFLIRNLVDEVRVGGDERGHSVELVLRLDAAGRDQPAPAGTE